MSCLAIEVASLTGIAKPMPMLPDWPPDDEPSEAMAELMPMSWPLALTRAPPLLPGLIIAEVWIALVTTVSDWVWVCPLGSAWGLLSASVVTGRLSALTM